MSSIDKAFRKSKGESTFSNDIKDPLEQPSASDSLAELDIEFVEEEIDVSSERLRSIQGVFSSDSLVGEQLRVLRAKIRKHHQTKILDRVGLVSVIPGEGKTTIALGLAFSAAQEPHRRVLLIESDLRSPSIEGYLGIEKTRGLGDWLQGTLSKVPIRKLPGGPFLLSAGESENVPFELLGTAQMTALMSAVRCNFDFVVVDCPPLLPVADSMVLQDLVDGLVVVVRARHGAAELIKASLSNLDDSRVLGIVFNDYKEIIPRYGRKTYPHYGYHYGYGGDENF